MIKSILLTFTLAFFISACSTSGVLLKGKLQRVTGNNMPSPDILREEPPGFAGTIYFFEPTIANQADPAREPGVYRMSGKIPVAMTKADSLGQFQIRLKPGRYSVLIGRDGLYYSNITDLDGSINPFTINRRETKQLVLRADWDAVY
jgi:hypothetical protein